jgi:hypothetical protein
MCPPYPTEMSDVVGTIEIPSARRSNFQTANCSWLIKAPPSQVDFFNAKI